jgi:hypothetical protein
MYQPKPVLVAKTDADHSSPGCEFMMARCTSMFRKANAKRCDEEAKHATASVSAGISRSRRLLAGQSGARSRWQQSTSRTVARNPEIELSLKNVPCQCEKLARLDLGFTVNGTSCVRQSQQSFCHGRIAWAALCITYRGFLRTAAGAETQPEWSLVRPLTRILVPNVSCSLTPSAPAQLASKPAHHGCLHGRSIEVGDR